MQPKEKTDKKMVKPIAKLSKSKKSLLIPDIRENLEDYAKTLGIQLGQKPKLFCSTPNLEMTEHLIDQAIKICNQMETENQEELDG